MTPATMERPTAVEPETTGVCHIHALPGTALCGATIDPDEPMCCDEELPPCGRPPCADCDAKAAELVGA